MCGLPLDGEKDFRDLHRMPQRGFFILPRNTAQTLRQLTQRALRMGQLSRARATERLLRRLLRNHTQPAKATSITPIKEPAKAVGYICWTPSRIVDNITSVVVVIRSTSGW